ncbi:unnamed protein product [Arabidopsis thaliana]|nr:unnamed protein product [Arabidopsis thaliana]
MWLEKTPKIPTAAEINAIISAELPNKITDPLGFELVEKHMMHGPCGTDRPSSPCMANKVCTKKSPRSYNAFTSVEKSGHFVYRCRPDQDNFVVKGGTRLDNQFVIPHNLPILKKYQAHINVEWCNTSNAIKYLFKYVTKGVDKATILIEKGTTTTFDTEDTIRVVKERNEIQEYLDCRYLSACEAIANIKRTMFTTWMEMNKHCEEARKYTYIEFPIHFVWDNDGKVWRKRQRGFSIGRIVNIHPTSGELYYLRILLNVVTGPQSYDELKTVHGEIKDSFKASCHARGLLDDDKEWHHAMDEANQWATPIQLRHLFVLLLIYCEVANPSRLGEHSWKSMSEDIPAKQRRPFGNQRMKFKDDELHHYTLIEIELLLHQHEKTLTEFKDMPKPDSNVLKQLGNSL